MDEGEIQRLKKALAQIEEERGIELNNYANNKRASDDFQRDRGLARRDVYNVAQAGVDLSRLSSALGQIKAGKQQREDAVRPSFNQREVSPELQGSYQRALERTGQGFTDAERASMAQLDMSGYSNALQSTAALGQGQANIAGVGAQALHSQNLKSNLERATADAQVRQSNDAYANQAGQALAADKDSLYRSNLQYNYIPALQDYRRKLGEAGITERQGRVNLDQLASVAPYRASNLVGNYFGDSVQRGNETPYGREQRIANRGVSQAGDPVGVDNSKANRMLKRQEYWKNLSDKFKFRRNPIDVNPQNPVSLEEDYAPYYPDLGLNQEEDYFNQGNSQNKYGKGN